MTIMPEIEVIPKRSRDTIRVGESATYEFGADTLSKYVAYSWIFPGGAPTTAFEPNPTIVYENPGIFGTLLKLTKIEGGKEFEGLIPVRLVVLDTANSSFAASSRMVEQGTSVTFMHTGNPASDLVSYSGFFYYRYR